MCGEESVKEIIELDVKVILVEGLHPTVLTQNDTSQSGEASSLLEMVPSGTNANAPIQEERARRLSNLGIEAINSRSMFIQNGS